MGTIRVRFILVALVVSFFAVGMAAFLNYFKYKSTIGGIVKSRVLVIGRGIENSVQASLQLGMQFSELGTLNQQLARERSADRMIRGMDVFDASGQVIYSSDRSRVGQKVPDAWIYAAERSKSTEWNSEAAEDYVAGISLKNSSDHRRLPRCAIHATGRPCRRDAAGRSWPRRSLPAGIAASRRSPSSW
jgi:hypothetical protein